ncbi:MULTISPECIES: DUF1772 domain-containing protein [unclassified Nocardia]|uniref:DUF1772 domain-containing protein n=1 Tax=unclassified Nocardia TaxID=2637762 RepID=UPI0024A86A19|nr:MULTISPECIES: DUF1772 domain-containing protein [unclassified Nocardia]
MHTLSYVAATLAVIGCAVTYGTDTFAAVVWRTSLRHLDERALTHLVGYVHYYGDRRLPIPGGFGMAAAAVALVSSIVAGRTEAAVAGGVAVAMLAAWMVLYLRVAKPVNEAFSAAALNGRTLERARELQARWDSVINLRVGIQMVALTALCAQLFLP